MTLVVDASIVVRLLANRPADKDLRGRLARFRTVHAPHLIDFEVASATRGLLRGGRIYLSRAVEMLADFAGLRIRRYPMHPHLGRVIELWNNLTAYDAVYVALAETLRMPLLTQDPKLARATGHHADMQVFPDWSQRVECAPLAHPGWIEVMQPVHAKWGSARTDLSG